MRIALTCAVIFAASQSWAEEAGDPKAAQCDALGGVVTQLVALRQDGKRENRAIRMLTKGNAAIDEPLRPAVQFLAGWVYSLTDDELGFEPGPKYAEACKTQ
ncbi:hypothetical protein N6L24_01070 [Cognatishimia sp. SS12]|uniref:hypothetical protein n=1 Tax=Cognatishimia sp. SS12 TaxID=2979465 RepID=UPI00232D757F|nr:hypothetical protein [Cognatishimia sp. SS12]MDC0736857.1 hypothetical protein [Cognatishimia sp. SS12]